MFVTSDSLQIRVPPGIAEPGHRFWGALTLSLEMHWYLVTHLVPEQGPAAYQTTLIAFESTLLSLLQAGGDTAFLSAHCVAPVEAGTHGWSLRRIQEFWEPAEDESVETGPLIFRFADEEGLRDSHFEPVTRPNASRRLLARTPS